MALDLSNQVRAAIAKFSEKLRTEFPFSEMDAHRRNSRDTEIYRRSSGKIVSRKLKMRLAKVNSVAPVEMNFRGAGFFPDERRPRVFWVGIDSTPNLADIAAQIETQLDPLGIARESREFKPHLTLARISESRGIDKLRDALRNTAQSISGLCARMKCICFKANSGAAEQNTRN